MSAWLVRIGIVITALVVVTGAGLGIGVLWLRTSLPTGDRTIAHGVSRLRTESHCLFRKNLRPGRIPDRFCRKNGFAKIVWKLGCERGACGIEGFKSLIFLDVYQHTHRAVVPCDKHRQPGGLVDVSTGTRLELCGCNCFL